MISLRYAARYPRSPVPPGWTRSGWSGWSWRYTRSSPTRSSTAGHRRPSPSVGRLVAVRHLADEPGLDPLHVAGVRAGYRPVERRRGAEQRAELAGEVVEHPVGEAGTDPADEDQLAGAVVLSQYQCADH